MCWISLLTLLHRFGPFLISNFQEFQFFYFHRPFITFQSSTSPSFFDMINVEREVFQVKAPAKRLSKKLRKSFVIKTNHEELSDVLCKLLKSLDISELHILTYKNHIDLFATKSMQPLHVELYEKLFSLSDDDIDRIAQYQFQIQSLKKDWLSLNVI